MDLQRDVSRRLGGTGEPAEELGQAVERLAHRVGEVSLKQLVEDTVSLVELHFIDAALQLTGDNRSAAAELLGLSRQSLIVTFEGSLRILNGALLVGGPFAEDLRSLGIVWSRPNAFGHGVPFRFPSSPDTGPGLTDAGKALVRACNELGILQGLSGSYAAGNQQRVDRRKVTPGALRHQAKA